MDSLVGIPGTIGDAAKGIRWRFVGDVLAGRRYVADVPDGKLLAIVSRDPAGVGGKLLWHVSVSHKSTDGTYRRVPTWDELKHAAYRLMHHADVPLVLIFPRRSAQHVNIADTCLHLWESEVEVDL